MNRMPSIRCPPILFIIIVIIIMFSFKLEQVTIYVYLYTNTSCIDRQYLVTPPFYIWLDTLFIFLFFSSSSLIHPAISGRILHHMTPVHRNRTYILWNWHDCFVWPVCFRKWIDIHNIQAWYWLYWCSAFHLLHIGWPVFGTWLPKRSKLEMIWIGT